MEILAKIGFDWQVALANLVNFLIIFFLLKKFLFGPIAKTLAERKKAISEGLQNAALATDALSEAKKEGDKIIAEAKAQANTIISGPGVVSPNASPSIISSWESQCSFSTLT